MPLEAKARETSSARLFRPLAKLLDVKLLEKVVQYLLGEGPTPQGPSALCNKLANQMWVGFHILHPENPRNHEERSMYVADLIVICASLSSRNPVRWPPLPVPDILCW